MAKEEPNVQTTVDLRGCKPDLNLINTYWRHTGNHNIYQLTGYCWHGDDDIWVIEFKRFEGGIGTKYTRSITNFTEDRQGKPRFEQIRMRTQTNQAHHFTKETPIMGQTEADAEKQTKQIQNMDSLD